MRHQFFSDLLGNGNQTIGCSPLDTTLQFWRQLWGLPCEQNPNALPDLDDILKTYDIPMMLEPTIAPELFAHAVSRIKNWKSTGLDCLYRYWIKQGISTKTNSSEDKLPPWYMSHLILTSP